MDAGTAKATLEQSSNLLQGLEDQSDYCHSLSESLRICLRCQRMRSNIATHTKSTISSDGSSANKESHSRSTSSKGNSRPKSRRIHLL